MFVCFWFLVLFIVHAQVVVIWWWWYYPAIWYSINVNKRRHWNAFCRTWSREYITNKLEMGCSYKDHQGTKEIMHEIERSDKHVCINKRIRKGVLLDFVQFWFYDFCECQDLLNIVYTIVLFSCNKDNGKDYILDSWIIDTWIIIKNFSYNTISKTWRLYEIF